MSLRKLATVVFPQEEEEKKEPDVLPPVEEGEGLEAVWSNEKNKNASSVRLLEPNAPRSPTRKSPRAKRNAFSPKKKASPKQKVSPKKKNLNTTMDTADDSVLAASPVPVNKKHVTNSNSKPKGPFLFGKKKNVKPNKRNLKGSPRGDAAFYVASNDNQVVKRSNNDKYKLQPVERFVAQIVVKDGAGEPLQSDFENHDDDDSDVISIKSIDEQTAKQLEEAMLADDASITSLEGVKKYGQNLDNPCLLVSPKDVLRGRRVTQKGINQHQGSDNRARPPVFRSPEFVACPQGPPAILVQHSWDSLLSNEDARPEDAPTIEFGDEELDALSKKDSPPRPLTISVEKTTVSPLGHKGKHKRTSPKTNRQLKQPASKESKQKQNKNVSKRRGFFRSTKQSGKENNQNKKTPWQSKKQSKAPQARKTAVKTSASPTKQNSPKTDARSLPMEKRVEEEEEGVREPRTIHEPPRQANPPTRAVSRATAHAMTALSVEHPWQDGEEDIAQTYPSGSSPTPLSVEKKHKPSFRKPVKMKHQTASEYLRGVIQLPPVIQRELDAEKEIAGVKHVVKERSAAPVMRQSSIMSEETYRF